MKSGILSPFGISLFVWYIELCFIWFVCHIHFCHLTVVMEMNWEMKGTLGNPLDFICYILEQTLRMSFIPFILLL